MVKVSHLRTHAYMLCWNVPASWVHKPFSFLNLVGMLRAVHDLCVPWLIVYHGLPLQESEEGRV